MFSSLTSSSLRWFVEDEGDCADDGWGSWVTREEAESLSRTEGTDTMVGGAPGRKETPTPSVLTAARNQSNDICKHLLFKGRYHTILHVVLSMYLKILFLRDVPIPIFLLVDIYPNI